MAKASADLNLLIGILALQMDFISREALIGAMSAWVFDKDKSLGQILAEQGQLSPPRRQALDALVHEHLQAHGADPHQSLAAVAVPANLRELLSKAGAAGYFSVSGNIEEMRLDPDLEPLRSRADFKKLVRELQDAGKRK